MNPVIITLFLLGCGFYTPGDATTAYPLVATPLGILEGIFNTTQAGRQYESYMGVPYAEPPTGDSRFQAAKPISPWSGVRQAKSFGPLCIQYRMTEKNVSQVVQGSEDCLYLNIFTPSSKPTALLPVIFNIPGGAFQVGSASSFGPKYLLDRNVILVTMNYRVGPMGFLNTEDETVPGNAGLKDQVMALLWVKNNIEFFGGNSARVTITGQSAGGVSVHYLYLTKLTKGLFQGGISLSGTALNPWSLTQNPLEKAKRLASAAGCSTDSIPTMVDCLRSRPALDIMQAAGVFQEWPYYPSNAFGPSIETVDSEFMIFDRSPQDIISSGDAHDVPWVTGVVSHEGLVSTAYYIADQKIFKELEESWERIGPFLLDYNDTRTIPDADKPKIARLIKEYYLGQLPFSRSTFDQMVQMFGDRMFASAVEKAAKPQAKSNQSPVYTYYFSYRGAHSLTDGMTGTTENYGVCHSDDMTYVFDISAVDPTTTPRDLDMQKVLIDLWVSFATDGKPDVGVEWPPLSRSPEDEYRFLRIAGPDEIYMESSSNFANKDLWQSINFE